MEKPNFKSTTNEAASHVRQEELTEQLLYVKRKCFEESQAAERAFEKIVENLSVETANENAIQLENLLYAIGRIRAYCK